MCQHKAPHREWLPALRHLGHDDDRRYPEPPTLFDDYSGRGKAEHDQDMTIAKTMTDVDLKLTPPPDPRPRAERKAWDAYYEPRNAAFREGQPRGRGPRPLEVPALPARLPRLRQGRRRERRPPARASSTTRAWPANTIVVYTSDQGFYLGEHGWFDKRWIFEESLRTPLLVRWPGVVKPGSANARHRLQHRLRRDVPRSGRLADSRGHAGPKPRSAADRARRRADWRKSFYYQYYEYPLPHHVRPALRRRDRPVQARPLRQPGRRRLGALRPGERPARAAERVRRPGLCGDCRRVRSASFGRLRNELGVPAETPAEASGAARGTRRP